jgi:hypothetical protein
MPRAEDIKRPQGRVVIADFPGLSPVPDPHDAQPGHSSTQVNVTAAFQGELRVRDGFRVLKFEG